MKVKHTLPELFFLNMFEIVGVFAVLAIIQQHCPQRVNCAASTILAW